MIIRARCTRVLGAWSRFHRTILLSVSAWTDAGVCDEHRYVVVRDTDTLPSASPELLYTLELASSDADDYPLEGSVRQ